ncbi:MAG TPA: NYN domain-containing protein [Phycisphaerae bacterium]|nr:NYN domain-containing protein [Phycisphaerae bacterium]HNU44111.1 NYN domain-containing protein [Phycisphaerae bacterium]
MPSVLLIDGNNLLYGVRALGPPGGVGRDGLLHAIEQWTHTHADAVTLVFDGAAPRGPGAARLHSARVRVLFGEGRSADDVIVDLLEQAADPQHTRVVTDDSVIRKNARRFHCGWMPNAEFIAELFPPVPAKPDEENPTHPAPKPESSAAAPAPGSAGAQQGQPEKPDGVSPQERRQWLKDFGFDES